VQFSKASHNLGDIQLEAKLVLYHTPCACSRVVLNAIEEIGEPYTEAPITLSKGEQYSPEYLAINPKGKVPCVVDDGVIYTEAPAILYHLASTRPEANLLPKTTDGLPKIECLSDMIWCSSALHPDMNKVVFPQNTSALDADGIRERSVEKLSKSAGQISERYADSPWYYGADWSIMDMYVTWIFNLAGQYGFPLADYPALVDLIARVKARPSFQRARAVEVAAIERVDLPMPPGMEV